jgi:hypothetical protein
VNEETRELAKATASVVREAIAREIEPVLGRIVALEEHEPKQGDKGEKGERGPPGEAVDYRLLAQELLEDTPERDAFYARLGELMKAMGFKGDRGEKGDPGTNGKDFDPALVTAEVERVLPGLVAEVRSALLEKVVDQIAQTISCLPPAKDGRPGKDADEAEITQRVTLAVSKTLADTVSAAVDAAVAAIPRPRDGESVHPDTVRLMVNEAVAALPAPKAGEPGRDALQLDILPALDRAKAYPRGTFCRFEGGMIHAFRNTEPLGEGGVDGDLEAAGWDVIVAGISSFVIEESGDGRNFVVKVAMTGGALAELPFSSPAMIYRGVWREQPWERGDVVTWDGSMWHCNEPTMDEPGKPESKGWTLCTKRGRDGRDFDDPRNKGPAPVVRIK